MKLVRFVRFAAPGSKVRHVWINPDAVDSVFEMEDKVHGRITRILTLAARDGDDPAYWDVLGELDDVAMQLQGFVRAE